MNKYYLLVVLLGAMLVGCGQNHAEPQRGAKWGRGPHEFPPPPPVQPTSIDPVLRAAAREQLFAAAGSSNPLVRSQAIEAIQKTLPQEGQSIIVHMLDDPSAQPRKAAVLAAGTLRLSTAYPKLLKMLEDPDPNVQVAVRYALHRLGDVRHSHDLEVFARDPRASVRGDVALVLGMLQEPTATRLLFPMQQDANAAVRLQVSEALWQLGQKAGLDDLIAGTISGYPDDQMITMLALAEPRDRRVAQHIRGGLTADYPEVRLVAARALGMLGYDDGYTVAAGALQSADPRQRALAALALGAIGRVDAQPLLTPLLNDGQDFVRVAAAMAILSLKA